MNRPDVEVESSGDQLLPKDSVTPGFRRAGDTLWECWRFRMILSLQTLCSAMSSLFWSLSSFILSCFFLTNSVYLFISNLAIWSLFVSDSATGFVGCSSWCLFPNVLLNFDSYFPLKLKCVKSLKLGIKLASFRIMRFASVKHLQVLAVWGFLSHLGQGQPSFLSTYC